jgi:periplasmic divalent cation tolerance protein
VSGAVFLYVTCPDAAQAQSLGRQLVDSALAACVNILPAMHSIYRWQGEVQSAAEAVMIVKTTDQAKAGAQAYILRNHPYDCPCIVELAVQGGNPAYLRWIAESCLPPATACPADP